jgi:hypothetical protein
MEEKKMKNKTLMIGLLVLLSVLGVSAVSAMSTCANGYASAYGCPSAYASQPVRVGGWFGGNSAYLTGLKQGVYNGPYNDYYTRNAIASQYYPSCGSYNSPCARVGGYFGNNYYNLRSGTFAYGGLSTSYATPSYYYHGLM